MSDTKHIDAVTGTATTGHEWDGIRELNTPLPRWWLYTIYATIVWGIGYIAYYPALPLINDATKGMSGWNARSEVVEEIGKLQALRGPMNDKLAKTALADVKKDADLLAFASAAGSAAFATNCAPCHGAGGQGAKGYPNLHTDRWIWGGKLQDIEQTIAHGIRWDADSKTRSGVMPAFGRDKILDQDQISQVADYVLSFTNRAPKDAKLTAGKKIYDDNCAACHGDTGKGNRELGAPNLTTQVWLYGGDKADIMERIRIGGGGVMPSWSGRLEPTTIKALAVYVHGFGGGETNVLFQVGSKAQAGGGTQERIASAAQVAQLYASRKKVYPQSVSGTYRKIKWAVLLIALGIYYFTPFLRWDRGADAPSQAVLIDLPGRRFYFFFIEIWPQEVYYITGLLIIAALTLFLMNAIAGRIWCGYLCPQTVWTDLFLAVERFVEGDRRERMLKDKSPWTAQRAAQKALKHFIWLMIAWWTGGAWVLYFADAPTLVRDLATFEAPFIAYMWIGILTFTTYLLAGHAREQVCIYMCPWPRIQAAMTDENALNVTYRLDRGEPRMSVKKAEQLRAAGAPAGDCVDCDQCVAVCPTGVDIRQGPNLGCIQCGLCIDACDTVMTKVHRPTRLIAFDTDVNIARRLEGKQPVYRLIRARTLLYVAIIAAVSAVMLFTLLTRSTLGVAAIHDRNPLLVTLSDGSVRNSFTVRISNKERREREFVLSMDGLPGVQVEAVGVDARRNGSPLIKVGPGQTREIRIHATLSHDQRAKLPREVDVQFKLQDMASHEEARTKEHFFTRLAQ